MGSWRNNYSVSNNNRNRPSLREKEGQRKPAFCHIYAVWLWADIVFRSKNLGHVPSDIKRCKSLNGFKTEVEKRISEGFLCSLCKVYLRQKELARPKIKNKNSKTYHGIFTVEADKHCYHYHILIFMSLNQIQIPMHV